MLSSKAWLRGGLVVLALLLTGLNVTILGTFIGKTVALHPDVNNLKERMGARVVVAMNGVAFLLLAFVFMGIVFYAGVQSYSQYAQAHGCNLAN